jgi:NADPH:quinone reductase-like Zn-dependent oxidoreductase
MPLKGSNNQVLARRGEEFSGVVEQIGSDVATWTPDDAVFGANGTGAAYAEYLAVKPATIAKKPSNLSL